ncbi:hypothetical protein E2C01_054842 [Portunus trituberculatus]|uniref:Uncharacterized protein n=1 Tax=Portunus trituberculatus TaxID=210409 RepID=A0A5B7GTA0_PORTR|nr:hypothetical protein [Portunus trituberculatus]
MSRVINDAQSRTYKVEAEARVTGGVISVAVTLELCLLVLDAHQAMTPKPLQFTVLWSSRNSFID